MEGTSSFDTPPTISNPSFGSSPPPISSNSNTILAANDSISTTTPTESATKPASSLVNDLDQFAYQPESTRKSNENVAAAGGGGGISKTAQFMDDVRKRWQQHVEEKGPPPAKVARTDSVTDPSLSTDRKSAEDSSGEDQPPQASDRKNSSAIAGPPLQSAAKRDLPDRMKQRRSGGDSDYSNSDDDKPDPPTPKSEGSNYEPSSAPTTDSEDADADEGLSDEKGSGDDYKPKKPKILVKKQKPLIPALAFLESNRRRRSSGSDQGEDDDDDVKEISGPEKDDDSGSGSQKDGKTLFRAKNSFEMLRRLREMKAKKRDGGDNSPKTSVAVGESSDHGGGKEATVYRIYLDHGDSSSPSNQRRDSVDDKNVDRSVTEKYGLSRKRQVLLSDDDEDDSNSNSKMTASSSTNKKDRSSPPNFSSSKRSGGKKRVVYSSDDSDGSERSWGKDEEDSRDSRHSDATPIYRAAVTRKPTRSELQGMCVKFFNEATQEQLSNIPRCSEKVAEALIAVRPFESFDDLLDKVDEIKVKGTSTELVHKHLQVVEWQNDLDRLLKACQSIADNIESSVNDLLAGKTETVSQPSTLSDEYSLKPYQVVGLNWLILMHRTGINAVLADEMGLGKTIQVIAFLAHLKQQNVRGPHIVVVPSSTMDNWMNEFRRWCPTLNVLTYYGSMDDRKFLRKEIQSGRQQFDVMLSTYRVITSHADDRAFFKKLRVGYAVFDEAHMLKSCNTARYKSLMKVKAKYRLLLTGTPLQNNLVELVSLLYFVMPTLFRDYTDDLKDILNLFQTKNGALGEYEHEKIEQAKGIMKPFVLRRLKADVLSQLPEKHELVEICELPGRQADLYGAFVAEYSASVSKRELGNGSGGGERADTTVGMFMQLRKVANHPLLVRSLYTDDILQRMAKALKREKSHKELTVEVICEDLSVMNDFQLHQMCKQHRTLSSFKLKSSDIEHSGKFMVLDRLLPDVKAQGNKVLLFSQFTMVLDVMEEFLKMRKYKYLRLDGSTPVVERQLMIDQFNTNPALFAFLLSTRAGGLGINLTSANTIILHDIDYNPYNDKQAEDRCHRVGQTKEVTVVRLIAKNTVDETMMACAQKKLQLEQQVTGVDQEEEENSRDVESLLKQALKL